MKAKVDAQQAVRDLRAQGLSYREILQRVPVAKSSISLWCRTVELDDVKRQVLRQRHLDAARNGLVKITQLRQAGQLRKTRRRPALPVVDPKELEELKRLYLDERLSFHEVAVRMGVGPWRVYRLMRLYGIPRRRGSEQNYATSDRRKPQFTVHESLTPEDEELRAVGTVVYRAEGAKRGHVVDFTNSDPLLIKVFLAFLRRVCGVAESRLRALVYCYADQDVDVLTRYWSNLTGIPPEQFTRPFVRRLTPNVSRRKMQWGLVHIRYADKRLLDLILKWSEEYINTRAGT